MKTFKMRWLPILLLATIGLFFSSCEGNNPDDDLTGVTTVYMKSGDWRSGNPTLISFGNDQYERYLYIDEDNNFVTYGHLDIIDVGKKKISQINTIPASGWQRQVAVIPGHGYIAKSSYGITLYVKIYVVDWMKNNYGGIIGAEVQYCEWNPNGSSNGDWNW